MDRIGSLLTQAAQNAGWRGSDLLMAVAVSFAETDGKIGLDSHFYNPPTHDDSWGPWQLNAWGDNWAELQQKYGIKRKEELLNLDLNAHIGHDKWLAAKGFSPWGSYKHETMWKEEWQRKSRWQRARAALTQFALEGKAMSWEVAPCLLAMMKEANALAPNRSKASDGTIGDASHAASVSDHNPDGRGIVHAVDLTQDPAGGWDCTKRVAEIVASRDRRVKYIIWNRTMWRAYDKPGIPAWSPAPYTGESPHTDHMHVSVQSGDTYENDVHPWFGQVAEEDELTSDEKKRLERCDQAVRPPTNDKGDIDVAHGKNAGYLWTTIFEMKAEIDRLVKKVGA